MVTTGWLTHKILTPGGAVLHGFVNHEFESYDRFEHPWFIIPALRLRQKSAGSDTRKRINKTVY